MGNIDRMLLVDCEPGFLNRVSTEYAARRAFGLEQAFRHCTRREDWLRPKNTGRMLGPVSTGWRKLTMHFRAAAPERRPPNPLLEVAHGLSAGAPRAASTNVGWGP